MVLEDQELVSEDITFLATKKRTPIFFLDLHKVREELDRFTELFPTTKIFYSTKTNPHPAILRVVATRGHGFDVATIQEIKLVLRYGALPYNLLYTHPVKSVAEIKKAYKLGVRRFTLDSLDELKRHHKYAPDAENFIRITPVSNASLYEYGGKFGAGPKEFEEIMEYAIENNMAIHGISFMVGSQSMSTKPWRVTFAHVQKLIEKYYTRMPSFRTINIGGGFPVEYDFEGVPSIKDIAVVVRQFVDDLPDDIELVAEPGRFIASPATVLITKVVQRVTRDGQNWLYTDANAYSGLIEIVENSGHFPYRISAEKKSDETAEFMVAGKTLDPDDVLGKKVRLSKDVTSGDLLYIHDTGAYSSSFFTNYHSLPHPNIIVWDSEFSATVGIGSSGMSITGVKAKRAIQKDDVIFRITGTPATRRSRTSFQISRAGHMEPNIYGAFLNHSCDPNAGIRTVNDSDAGLEVVAFRPIQEGDDITADYAMFEYETSSMSKVECLCGAERCRKFITGYKDLPEEFRNWYHGFTAEHLLPEEAV